MASATPGIVHNVNVLTTVSTLASGGDSLTRQTQEFHIQLRLASLPLGSLYHSWIGFQRVKFLHFRWIVVWEIHARSDADLQDRALRLWKKPLANLVNGLRIAEHRDNVRIDPVL